MALTERQCWCSDGKCAIKEQQKKRQRNKSIINYIHGLMDVVWTISIACVIFKIFGYLAPHLTWGVVIFNLVICTGLYYYTKWLKGKYQ